MSKQKKAVYLTDQEVTMASGGSQGQAYTFVCQNCGSENTMLPDGAHTQAICQFCGYNNSTRKKSPYDGKQGS